MAETVLQEAGLTGDETDKASADKWYANYKDEFTAYGVVDKEVDFLIENFKHYVLEARADIFALPGYVKYGGIRRVAQILSGEKQLTQNDKKFFLMYGGAWLSFVKTAKGKGKWDEDDIKNVENLMQKFIFDKLGGGTDLFAGVDASYADFSFNKFKARAADGINEWLETNPEIDGLNRIAYSGGTSRTWYWFQNPIKEIPSNVKKGDFTFTDAEKKVLKHNFLYLPKVKYKSYAPGQDNTVRINSNLEAIGVGAGTEGGFFTDERQNYVRRVYFQDFLSRAIVEHYKIMVAQGTSNQAAVSQIRAQSRTELEKNFKLASNSKSRMVNIRNDQLISGEKASQGLYGYKIAQSILNEIRVNAFSEILKLFEKWPDQITIEDAKKAFQSAEDKAKADAEVTGNDIPVDQLTEEEIKAKQKFLKQCLLMSRVDDLAKEQIDFLQKKTTIHETLPYRGRFYMVGEQGDEQSSINKLLIPNARDVSAFKNIKPDEHAALIPKLRFYKVFTNRSGKLEQKEFKFPKHSNSARVNKLSRPGVFDKGSDFGVKEFSFSFEGSSPATARNDIKANLTLYFQSFRDFVEKKPLNDNMSYVELLLLPSGKKTGSGNASKVQTDASYYRIRVDVGWEPDSAPNQSIRQAIQKINKSFYLNMIDHDINIRDDGSVEIKATYRAYIESALKGSTLNALASKDVNNKLKAIREEYNKFLETAKCTVKQLNTIRNQYLQIEENLKKSSLQSIIKRLVDLDMVRNVKVRPSTARSFERTGFISEQANFVTDNIPADQAQKLSEKSKDAKKVMEEKKASVQLNNSEDNLMINYFYLGDLLYVITDVLYLEEKKNINETYAPGAENFKFILGSFQYINYFRSNNAQSINLSLIPISVELFSEWFTENVIKPERKSYPIMYFIRDLVTYLVGEILMESCFRNDLEKTLQFKTTSFLGASAKAGGDPIGRRLIEKKKIVLDLTSEYSKSGGILPLRSDLGSGQVDISNMYNYIAIYAVLPKVNTNKKGSKIDDEKEGIFHYQLGRPRGIIKKINFSKSDMQYIREARFFRHGHDGLMQLSAVYKATLEMVGNTLYYPGMEVFIDPQGLLGAGTDFDPRIGAVGTSQPSIANKLGLGGYHVVTRVNSSIAPGKFTTSVEAMFSYSGDGDPLSSVIGRKSNVENQEISHFDQKNIAKPGSEQAACDAQIDYLYRRSLATAYDVEVSTQDIKNPPPAAQQSAAAATQAVPSAPASSPPPPPPATSTEATSSPTNVQGGAGLNVPL